VVTSRLRHHLLIISAQMPYPVRSGFQARVFNLAIAAAAEHDVTVLAYATPSATLPPEASLPRGLRLELVPHVPPQGWAKRVAQLRCLATATPWTTSSVTTPQLAEAARRIAREEHVSVVMLESSALAGLPGPGALPVILDEHNIEYEVSQRLARGESSPVRRVFHMLEARRVRRVEQAAWRSVHTTLVTSEREASLIRATHPDVRVVVVPNGVDVEAFAPVPGIPREPGLVVFNGVLDYRPNLDAARWLVEEVWPRVRSAVPTARLLIVGRGSAADRRHLDRDGVATTGEVPSVAALLGRAAVVVVPVRMGGGTRLKVVEALAMSRPIVSTTLGCEGIDVIDGEHLLIADTPDDIAMATVRILNDERLGAQLGVRGRALAVERYGWDVAARGLLDTLRRIPPKPGTSVADAPHPILAPNQ
jgi:glycosyltransferase involved in cell wall biosynthesis